MISNSTSLPQDHWAHLMLSDQIDVNDPNREDYSPDKASPAERGLWLYGTPWLLVLGIPGNTLCVITIILKKQLRKTGENISYLF